MGGMVSVCIAEVEVRGPAASSAVIFYDLRKKVHSLGQEAQGQAELISLALWSLRTCSVPDGGHVGTGGWGRNKSSK